MFWAVICEATYMVYNCSMDLIFLPFLHILINNLRIRMHDCSGERFTISVAHQSMKFALGLQHCSIPTK